MKNHWNFDNFRVYHHLSKLDKFSTLKYRKSKRRDETKHKPKKKAIGNGKENKWIETERQKSSIIRKLYLSSKCHYSSVDVINDIKRLKRVSNRYKYLNIEHFSTESMTFVLFLYHSFPHSFHSFSLSVSLSLLFQ